MHFTGWLPRVLNQACLVQGNYESSVYIICSGVMALFKVDDEADEEICVQHCQVRATTPT